MKKLLVPTDFSNAAENALRFASELAKNLTAEITIWHSYHNTDITMDGAASLITDELERRQETELDMYTVLEKFQRVYPQNHYKMIITENGITNNIDEICNSTVFDLVILGTNGISIEGEIFLGSKSIRILESANYPSLIIPEETKISDIQKVGFAIDYGKYPYQRAKELIELLSGLKVSVYLIHVSSKQFFEPMEIQELEGLKAGLINETNYQSVNTVLINGNNIVDSLKEYVTKNNIDLLTLDMKNRTFFEKMFHKSVTKRLIHGSNIPLLIFKSDSE